MVGLVAATSASAALTPVHRDARENALPRVRAGTLVVPPAHRRGLTRVIVRLAAPPLAALGSEHSLAGPAAAHRLDVRTVSSRAYLSHLAHLQSVAAAQVRAAIPQARIQEHYGIVLDGFAVELPATSLARLVALPAVTRAYPSLTYTRTMDRGPSVIHAGDLQAATGDKGQGVKIAVVDTGIDPSSPFLAPAGFSYPAGFPKGDTRRTTPKVIAARVFPGPLRDKLSNQAFDASEPHGTHVAGIAAGDEGTNAPAGLDHPATANLSGVAPRAWIGNYRVFTVPTPFGHEADTPEIISAFEAAVRDGMNVINFSGGGPQTDPANDAMNEAVHNTALAGVVPVIASGNDRDDYGLGSTGSPGTAPDAISVAAVSNSHVFAPALSVVGGPPSLGAVPIQIAGTAARVGDQRPDDHRRRHRRRHGRQARRSATSAARRRIRTPASATLPNGSLAGKIALVSRGRCSFASKAARALLGDAVGIVLVDNRPGEANPIPLQLPVPAGMIADLDGHALRAFADANGGQAKIRISNDVREVADEPERRRHELLLGRPDRLRPPPEARPLRTRARRALVDPARDHRLDVRGLRGNLDGDTARRRRGGTAAAAASDVDVVAGQVGADVDRRPGLG